LAFIGLGTLDEKQPDKIRSMKIMVFTDWFFPGSQAGGPIQSLISFMKFSSDSFYVITRNTDLNRFIPNSDVRSNACQESFQENIQVYYLNENSMTEDFILKIYSEINPDRVYLNSMWSPKFTLLPLKVFRKLNLSSKVVLAPRGMLKPAAFNQKGFKKKMFLLLAKFNQLYSNINWHATSEVEKNEILQRFPKAVIRIAPNISNATISKRKKELTSPFRILTVGRISPEKGYYEAIETFSNWRPKTSIHWEIVGLEENSELAKSIRTIANENAQIQITLHGHKNQEELNEFYENAHLFFLPTRGENYGHAIAEALCNGIPVVVSDQTPWNNLEEAKAGKSSSLNPVLLAEGLDFFLNLNSDEYHIWSLGATNYAKRHVNSPETLYQNKSLFASE
jgi:glycosyltransferase involved in cell wall biosynthesis